MSIIKSTIKTAITKIYQYKATTQLSQLRNTKTLQTGKIATAIHDAIRNELDPVERQWVDRIEEKRRALNNSTEKISKTDFGAGNPDLTQTEDEMYEGVTRDTTVGKTCRKASKPYFWSLLLFKLIREFRPSICIELGTCLGISGAYQASAQKINKNGNLITLEGAKSLAALAEKNLQQLGLDNAEVVCGRFQDTLDRVLTENKPIDYAFIDGHHDEKATILYFEQFLPCLSKNSMIIFDDISWSDGMRNAWETIKNHKAVKISVDLGVIGICVLDDNIDKKYSFRIPMF